MNTVLNRTDPSLSESNKDVSISSLCLYNVHMIHVGSFIWNQQNPDIFKCHRIYLWQRKLTSIGIETHQ